jgi:hypothetical protein
MQIGLVEKLVPTTDAAKEVCQVNVDITTSTAMDNSNETAPNENNLKNVENPNPEFPEDVKSAMLLRASKMTLPSYTYFIMFLLFCYLELNRVAAAYLTYLSLLVFATALPEIILFEIS